MSRTLSRIVLTVALLAVTPAAFAQAPNYQPVRVDLTSYYGYSPSDNGAAHGFGVALEPKYNLTDNLAVGLRLEAAGFVSQKISVEQGGTSQGVSLSQGGRGLYTFLAKADYYLTTSYARPFVGLGAGYYKVGAGSQKVEAGGSSGSTIKQAAGSFSGFGVCPQLGINLGGFRLAVAYHFIIGGDSSVVTQTVGTTESTTVKLTNNFFSFEIGGTFGGNRLPPPSAPAPYYGPGPAPGYAPAPAPGYAPAPAPGYAPAPAPYYPPAPGN
jgi:hypothetical protein